MMLYVQDYDETFPYNRFHGALGTPVTKNIDSWRNAILPYIKNVDVYACPSNPNSRPTPGVQGSIPPKAGANAEGWEFAAGARMPISYNMNQCVSSWIPADDKRAPPPIRAAQMTRPTETILIGETLWPTSDFGAEWLWNYCAALHTHPAGRMSNFIFFDGHVKSKKWLDTLYPVNKNNWEPGDPNPDPNNRKLNGTPPCTYTAPSGPEAKEFQKADCLAVHR
jgi:prepilin-type processing-associated H-X9-DG protein